MAVLAVSCAISLFRVAFRDIGRNGKRSAIKLIDEKIVSARKCLGKCRHPVCKVYRFLVDLQFFKHERHVRGAVEEE